MLRSEISFYHHTEQLHQDISHVSFRQQHHCLTFPGAIAPISLYPSSKARTRPVNLQESKISTNQLTFAQTFSYLISRNSVLLPKNMPNTNHVRRSKVPELLWVWLWTRIVGGRHVISASRHIEGARAKRLVGRDSNNAIFERCEGSLLILWE